MFHFAFYTRTLEKVVVMKLIAHTKIKHCTWLRFIFSVTTIQEMMKKSTRNFLRLPMNSSHTSCVWWAQAFLHDQFWRIQSALATFWNFMMESVSGRRAQPPQCYILAGQKHSLTRSPSLMHTSGRMSRYFVWTLILMVSFKSLLGLSRDYLRYYVRPYMGLTGIFIVLCNILLWDTF